MLPVKYVQQFDAYYDQEDETVSEFIERQRYMRELNRRYANVATKLAFSELGFACGAANVRRDLHLHRLANPIGFIGNDALGGVGPASTAPELLRQNMCARLELSELKEVQSQHRGPVMALSIDRPEQRYLLTAGNDCAVCLYDLETDVGLGELRHEGGDAVYPPACKKRRIGCAKDAAASPMTPTADGSHQQTARRKRCVFQPIARISRPQGHEYAVSCCEWYPSDTGLFVTGSFDRYVAVWDTNELVRVSKFKLPDKVYSISMSPCSAGSRNMIAVGSRHQNARLIDLASGTMTHSLVGHRDAVMAVQFSPTDEHLLATASSDKTVRLWDIRKAGWLVCLDQHNTPENPRDGAADGSGNSASVFSTKKLHAAATVPFAHDAMVNALQFTPDGRHLVTSGKDHKARLWEVASGRNTLTSYAGISNCPQTSFQFAISQNGQVLYHPNEGIIGCYDLFSGKLLGELAGHYSYVNALAFFGREQELLSASSDRQIFVWSPKHTNDSYRDAVDDASLRDVDTWSDTEY